MSLTTSTRKTPAPSARSDAGAGNSCRVSTSVTVEIPAALRRHAGGESRVQATTSATVGDALQVLAERYPALRPQLFAADGRLFGFVGVFLNSDDVRRLQGMHTPLTHGDVIAVVPAIAGG